MRKNLFICETPFQILVAILMIYDEFRECVNDFIIVDTMVDYEKITTRLKELSFVDYAYAAKMENITTSRCLLKRVIESFKSFSQKWDYKKVQFQYDYIFCRNYTSPITEYAFRYFKKINHKLRVCIIDEGYSNYLSSFWSSHKEISIGHKALNFILSGHTNYIYKNIEEIRLFEPDLFHLNQPIKVRRMVSNQFIVTKEILDSINYVFDYTENNSVFDGQCVFFEECFALDVGNYNDIEIVKSLSKAMGKKNVLIKLHPRSHVDRFSSQGYTVLKSARYPWEVFVLNNLHKKMTMISYSSGALVNYLFFSKGNMKSVFLYDVFPGIYKHMNSLEIRRWFNEIQAKNTDVICTPVSMEEVVSIVTENNSKNQTQEIMPTYEKTVNNSGKIQVVK